MSLNVNLHSTQILLSKEIFKMHIELENANYTKFESHESMMEGIVQLQTRSQAAVEILGCSQSGAHKI